MKHARHAARSAAPFAATLAAAMLLAGCAPRQTTTPRDLAALAACRERADEVFQKQNREDVYRSDVFATSSRDAPYATSGLPGITTRGLSGEYQRDNMVDDCLNASAIDRTPPAPAQAPGLAPMQTTPTPTPAAPVQTAPAQPAGTASPSVAPPSDLLP